MRLLARVELRDGRLVVALAPHTPMFDVTGTDVREGMVARIAIPALPARSPEAIFALFASRPGGYVLLDHEECKPAVLADFVSLDNGDEHVAAIPLQFGAQEVLAFVRDAGTILRANLRVDLAYERPTLASAPSALRLLRVVGGDAAAELVAELASLEPIEQMLALDHALEHAIADGGPHRTRELAGLLATMPDGVGLTFESRVWREWWWRLGFASRDREFLLAVAYAVGAAQARCRPGDAAALDAALARMQATHLCRWFTRSPAFYAGPSWPGHETIDGHFQALAALGLAAERLAGGADMDAAQHELATLVLGHLRFTPNNAA